ncbi:MAG: hydrogenase maturation protein [Acidobacteria bacterium]|nr:hydrogenase maturation protein [Acidobacteriota bacterium]
MRLLLLTHAFNSLAQRIFLDLQVQGHTVSVEFDIADAVTEEALTLFKPHLVVAPFLKRRLPEAVWGRVPCFIIHPGPPGDRGPSSLDWAIKEGASRWGVTVLQAEGELDGGPVWAHEAFAMRPASKSSLYRHEVTEAAVRALGTALERFEAGAGPLFRPEGEAIRARPAMRQVDRAIRWETDGVEEILRKLRAADGQPGVAAHLFGEPCRLYDPRPESGAFRGEAGQALGRREGALLVGARDGAFWVGQARREGRIKLPASQAFPEGSAALPELPSETGWWRSPQDTWQDISYEERGPVGLLRFEFSHGAMGTEQCRRLRQAVEWSLGRPARVLVLAGGPDFWSNGMHLNLIEASPSPADASWENINALDDLAETILGAQDRLVVAALQGNAGAGGCFLARAADEVWVRQGVVLNPHYKNMGNLHGSEFWTYLLPARVGEAGARAILRHRLPMGAEEAVRTGFYDALLPGDPAGFHAELARRAEKLAGESFFARLEAKRGRRVADEARKSLAAYRSEELAEMRRNFFGFDPSYHVARARFVRKDPPAWTPRHLALHRELGWRVPQP